MKTKLTKKTVTIAAAIAVALGALAYAAETYSYKCTKCQLIQTYSNSQGAGPKCPNDGNLMFPYYK